MNFFTYHIAKIPFASVLRFKSFRIEPADIPGLIHAEPMTIMTLGSAVYSPSRMLFRQIAVFAQWNAADSADRFLRQNRWGRMLAQGWHVRLELVRQWGSISDFQIPALPQQLLPITGPVVAVTVARMRLSEVPRFIRWGRPVEKLVRDHPGTTLALASIRLPNTISTFSVWKSQEEMTDMVRGHSAVPQPSRHADAMNERDRKDFHYEFTTLRFRPLLESGSWKGVSDFIPGCPKADF